MSEEVLGVVRVSRVSYTDPLPRIYETLYFTPDRTAVARTSIIQKEGIFLGVIATVVAAVGGFMLGPRSSIHLESHRDLSNLHDLVLGLCLQAFFY